MSYSSTLSKMSSLWDTGITYLNEMSLTTKVVIGGTSLLLLIHWVRQKKSRLPPGPRRLPFVGNLLSLRNKAMENVIEDWEREFGPVFTVYLGPLQVIVITDIDLASDALVKQGSTFSGRPFFYSLDRMSDGSKDIAFSPYGELWKVQKKVTVQALRQYLSGNQFEDRVHESVSIVLQNMEKETGPFDLHMHLSLCVFNILVGLCFGEIFDYEDPTFRKMAAVIDEFQDKGADGFLEDLFPPLRLWPTRKFTDVMKQMDWFLDFIYKRMNEHRTNFDEGAITCLADNMIQAERLAEAEDQPSDQKLTESHYAQIVSDVFGAGVDTVRTTIDWIFLVLVNYPEIQARMQKEIDTVVGEKVPGRENRHKLAYCEAVIFEAMRLYPAAPYALLHETLSDAEIGGYQIPKNTTVIFSFLKIMRDPNHWEDPLTFKPERFLDEAESKVTVRSKSFIPFSMGHRACLGEALAKMEILYVVVGLLQKYTFSLPPGEKVEPITLVQGFANQPTPYKVVIKQR